MAPRRKRVNREQRFTLADARKALMIDRDDLDEELIRHPTLVAEIGDALAIANDERDRAKDAMEHAEAEAYLSAKSKAEKGSTDNSVKQVAKIADRVIKAQEKYREAKAEAAKWDAMWTAIVQRKSMLDSLADIFVRQMHLDGAAYERPTYERTRKRKGRKA